MEPENAEEHETEELSEPPEKKEFQGEDSNIIFIGSKPIINYVRSISVQLNKSQGSDIIVRSRGRFISKAVDIVEIAKRKFLEKENIRVKNIQIASEEFEKEGRQTHVSTMDIVLGK